MNGARRGMNCVVLNVSVASWAGMVPRRRLELPRPCGHRYLKPARLPIPPPGHGRDGACTRRRQRRARCSERCGWRRHTAVRTRLAASTTGALSRCRSRGDGRWRRAAWRRCSAAPASSAATWSSGWPRKGYIVRVAVRNPERRAFLKPMGEVGQIVPLYAAGDR